MAAIDKVRVIVVGDSGVGKSSLTHLVCHQEPIHSPLWTIGCSVEVKLHEFKEGTPLQKTYFVELWDVGGSSSHRNTRSVFYTPTHGIILVHDLTNRKSQQNLQKWLAEVLNRDSNAKSRNSSFDDFDPEQFVGSTQVPILVIGTKLDLAFEVRAHPHRRTSTIAEECGADEIFLDCCQSRSLAAGTSSSVKLSRFFDKVIERRFYGRDGLNPFSDKRRPASALSPNSKYHHND
ncbi:rab-like protein 3 [Bacillus rossius redtenbacheri]|uniref:rab-like protein 3 n=1 Tax=Bacillus rossius redtenbacheri TaxID=93214 RepID=UPI002FDE51D9